LAHAASRLSLVCCVLCAAVLLAFSRVARSARTPITVFGPAPHPSSTPPPSLPKARLSAAAAAPPLKRYHSTAQPPSRPRSRVPSPAGSPPLLHLKRRAVVDTPLSPSPPPAPTPPALWPQTLPLSSRSSPLTAHLNRRFVAGAPSNSLSEAGVPLHILDGFERSDKPWKFDPSDPIGDRASASIVNARHPDVDENLLRPVGSQRMPGFVLADAPTQEQLSCAFSGMEGRTRRVKTATTAIRRACRAAW
jgi:hypothetical protein